MLPGIRRRERHRQGDSPALDPMPMPLVPPRLDALGLTGSTSTGSHGSHAAWLCMATACALLD